MISLTREDRAKINYALETKSLALRQGRHGIEDDPGADAKWLAHLDALRQKIGPDGTSAASEGVAPTKSGKLSTTNSHTLSATICKGWRGWR
jgi:hypothetical protein